MLDLNIELRTGSEEKGVGWQGEQSLDLASSGPYFVCSAGAQNQVVGAPVFVMGFPLYASCILGLVSVQPELGFHGYSLWKTLEYPWL